MEKKNKKKSAYSAGAEYLIDLIENSSEEACKQIDKNVYTMLENRGFKTSNKKVLKQNLDNARLGLVFQYNTIGETGDIVLWYELWRYDIHWNAIERIDETKKMKIKVNGKIVEVKKEGK